MARAPLDLYATPPEVAARICERLYQEVRVPDLIIEPSAGPGRFVAAARAIWASARIIAVDVDGAHREACLAAGAEFHECDWPTWAERHGRPGGQRLLILGNPPFSHAAAHIEAALRLLRDGEHLAFLLRQSILGAQDRIEFWERAPLRSEAMILPRIPFTGEGGDSADCELFDWEKGYRGRAERFPAVLWGKALADREASKKQLQLIGGAR